MGGGPPNLSPNPTVNSWLNDNMFSGLQSLTEGITSRIPEKRWHVRPTLVECTAIVRIIIHKVHPRTWILPKIANNVKTPRIQVKSPVVVKCHANL